MTYAPETDPLAVVLDLGSQYSVVTDPAALDFDQAFELPATPFPEWG